MLALRNVSARVSSFNNFVARSLSVVLPSPTKVKRGEGRGGYVGYSLRDHREFGLHVKLRNV